MNILLLASNDLAALNSARIFKKQNFRVFNIYLTRKTPLNYSNSVFKSSFIGNPFYEYKKFKKELLNYVENNAIKVVFPINDIALDIIFDCKKDLNKYCQLIIPNEKAYKIARNKLETVKLAKKLKIPVADYIVIQNLYFPRVSYPCYLKPVSSTLINSNKCYSFDVKKVNNKSQMVGFLRETINILPVMIQKIIEGKGVGVNVFCRKGKIISFTVNKRIHEPLNGGGSSYRKSIEIDMTLKKYVESLVSAINLDGAMMFEFKATKKNYVLMEINPRLWGSLSLSTFSGVNFPMLMIGNSDLEFDNYKYGLYSRNLRKDIKWVFIKILKTKNIYHLLNWLLTFRRIFINKEVLDVEDINDIKPSFFQFYILFEENLKKVLFIFHKKMLQIRGKQKQLKLKESHKLLFVCKGNINRSAFAENYVKNFYPKFNCDSAGSLCKRGRMTSSEGLLTAKKFNVDLNKHVSKVIYDLNINAFDKILVFDWDNYLSFLKIYPDCKHKVFLLKYKFSKYNLFVRPKEISDPIGKSRAFYFECFKQIKYSIDKNFKV
tara:strand:- start:1818 stop:3461 length:1644 start_codon:yes stop_codon:yes gene_type:complete